MNIAHGMMTPASPHTGQELFWFARGETVENSPFGPCASSTSNSHLVKKAETSVLRAAVGAKTCASPIQPMRSSRCGQSVGTLKKFPRWPHVMLEKSWLRSLSDDSHVPVAGVSEPT